MSDFDILGYLSISVPQNIVASLQPTSGGCKIIRSKQEPPAGKQLDFECQTYPDVPGKNWTLRPRRRMGAKRSITPPPQRVSQASLEEKRYTSPQVHRKMRPTEWGTGTPVLGSKPGQKNNGVQAKISENS